MGNGKYCTIEQKNIRHDLNKIVGRMNYYHKKYIELDVLKVNKIAELRRLGIEYGNKYKKNKKI